MNASLTSEIRNLAAHHARPSVILRRILDHKDHRKMNRLGLFKEVRDLFDIDLGSILPVGGWNYWDGEGFNDDELDELLRGKLTLKVCETQAP
jgi:hypothetical protein